MPEARILRLFYKDKLKARAEAGEHNFTNRLRAAFEGEGFSVELMRNSGVARMATVLRPGLAIFDEGAPLHPRALAMRLAYIYPFWRLENSDKRWEFAVAKQAFDAGRVDAAEARAFAERWRGWIFKGQQVEDAGFVFVPLQGHVTEKRSFQAMSPVAMLRRTQAAYPGQRILATLHPGEVYSPQDHAALQAVLTDCPDVELSTTRSEVLLAACSRVVTQNSSLAFQGLFLRKPLVLCAEIDFHHIAGSVPREGDAAFVRPDPQPEEFDAYLYWFLQLTAINAGREDAEARILETVRSRGWQI